MSKPVLRSSAKISKGGDTKMQSEEKKDDLVKKKLKRTSKFDLKNMTEIRYEHDDVVRSMKPEEFTEEYYHRSGLEEVLVFDQPPEGLKVPPSFFTIKMVAKRLGVEKSVTYHNVRTQKSFSTNMADFVKHYYDPERKDVVNVISQEISGTELQDYVQAPDLVRKVDLASSWSDSQKQRRITFDERKRETDLKIFSFENQYPRVEHFCLMSAEGSYTGYHIDFHGSSVWYHVLKGEKIFFIIEPTDENIKKYEDFLEDEYDFSFFGEKVDKCTRVVVKAGQTLLLPSGWIHAVFTPIDSLVFGGNFIHARSLEMQLKIVNHEIKMKLSKDEKYPQADEVVFHKIEDIVKKVTGRVHIRPTPRNRQDEGLQYVGEKFFEMGNHRLIPTEEDVINKQSKLWKRVDEGEEYLEMKDVLDEYDKADVEKINANEFLMTAHPEVFYHPKPFEQHLALEEGNPCSRVLPNWIIDAQTKMKIDMDILQQLIHTSEINGWRALMKHLLNKETINFPEGLTRPHSLVHSFCLLLKELRLLEATKKVADSAQNVNHKRPFKEEVTPDDEAKANTQPNTSKLMEPPQKKTRVKKENVHPSSSDPTTVSITSDVELHESGGLCSSSAALASENDTTILNIHAQAETPRSSSFIHKWTAVEDEKIVEVCREYLKRSSYLFAAENISAIHQRLPNRSLDSISYRVKKLRMRNHELVKLLEDFKRAHEGRHAIEEYSKEEDSEIINVCRESLSKALTVSCDETLAAIHAKLQNRSIHSIKLRVREMKRQHPEMKRMIEDFGRVAQKRDHYTAADDQEIVNICRAYLEKTSTRKLRKYAKLSSDKNLAEIHAALPTKKLDSIKRRIDKLKRTNKELIKCIAQFKKEAKAESRSSSPYNPKWTAAEDEKIIEVCREYLKRSSNLGADDNVSTIQQYLSHRSLQSISYRVKALRTQNPVLMQMLEEFKDAHDGRHAFEEYTEEEDAQILTVCRESVNKSLTVSCEETLAAIHAKLQNRAIGSIRKHVKDMKMQNPEMKKIIEEAGKVARTCEHYTAEEDEEIVESCRTYLKKTSTRKRRTYHKLGSDENLKAIKAVLHHKTIGSIRGRLEILKKKNQVLIKLIKQFKNGETIQ